VINKLPSLGGSSKLRGLGLKLYVIISRRRKYDKQPSQQVEIERANSMKILGITLNKELKVDEHIKSLIKSSLTSL